MTELELVAALEQRGSTSLLNPDELTPEVLSAVAKESLELTEGKTIPKAMLLDIAIFRLKLHLKIEVSETDETLYKQAIKKVHSTPLTSDDGTETSTQVKYGQRSSQWDMDDSVTDFVKAPL